MRFFQRCVLLLSATVALTAFSVAGYLESDFPSKIASPEPARTFPRPRPIPPQENEVATLIDRVTVHGPIRYSGLTLFPLVVDADEPVHGVRTLAQAMAAGSVSIQELSPPVVERAIFVNSGANFVFAMAGEIIGGGMQNRTLSSDVLLSPESSVTVDLYCIEKGRWAGTKTTLGVHAGLAPNELRHSVQAKKNQAQIWEQVASRRSVLRIETETEDLATILRDEKVTRMLTPCREYILPRLPGRCVGVVAARGPRIIGAELFADADLFTNLRDRILDSFAMDVLFRPEFGKSAKRIKLRPWAPPTVEEVRRFLDRARQASLGPQNTPGAGRLLRLTGSADGHALVWRGRCLHLSLSGPVTVQPLRAQEDQGN